jgi:hypothetical protein
MYKIREVPKLSWRLAPAELRDSTDQPGAATVINEWAQKNDGSYREQGNEQGNEQGRSGAGR